MCLQKEERERCLHLETRAVNRTECGSSPATGCVSKAGDGERERGDGGGGERGEERERGEKRQRGAGGGEGAGVAYL